MNAFLLLRNKTYEHSLTSVIQDTRTLVMDVWQELEWTDPRLTRDKTWGYRCLKYGHLTLYFTTGRSNTYYFNELNLSRLYVYDVINHGYEVSILILYTLILCSKFNDSVFCISSNVNKQTKPKNQIINNKVLIFQRFDQMLMIMVMPPLN
jgi:hypothetical protein